MFIRNLFSIETGYYYQLKNYLPPIPAFRSMFADSLIYVMLGDCPSLLAISSAASIRLSSIKAMFEN